MFWEAILHEGGCFGSGDPAPSCLGTVEENDPFMCRGACLQWVREGGFPQSGGGSFYSILMQRRG